MALTTVPASLSATAITLTTAAQPNITSVGTLTGLTVSGNTALTLNTSAQPNITSVGTLTALTISGNLTVDTNTLKVDSSNNRVGIGTASPGYIFEIQEASYSRLSLRQSTTGKRWQLGNDGSNLYIFDESASKRVIDFKSDGNVGIGVTNPQVALHIRGSAVSGATFAAADGLTIEQPDSGGSNINIISTSSTQGGILFSDGDTRAEGRINYIHASDHMEFYTDSAERMRIDSSGNVGIGTGTSTLLGKLHIAETAGGAAGVDFPIVLSSDRYQADYGLGIVFRPENLSTNYAHKTAIIGSGGGYGYNQADLHFCLNQDNDVTTEVSLSDARVTIKKNGNVGIGTNDPSRALEVSTDGTAQFRLSRVDSTINGNNTIGSIEFMGTDDTAGTVGATIVAHASTTWGGGAYPTDLRFSTMTGSTLSEAMRIDSSGNVIINKSSFSSLPTGSKLNIFGDGVTLRLDGSSGTTKSILFRGTNVANPGEVYADGSLRFRTEDASTRITFHTNSSGSNNERMRIDSSGNVGIGTNGDAVSWARLQVTGTAGSQPSGSGAQALYVNAPTTTANEGVGIRLSAASGSKEAVGIIGMVNNASGNSGSMTFHTYNGGATIPEVMRIDNTGRVIKPYQPYFQAFRSGSQSGYNASGNFASVVIFNNATINVGGHYNASTGYFTAPVEGIYIFFAAAYISGWAAGQSWFSSTSGRLSGTDIVYSSSKIFPEASIIIKMGANDTVGFHPYAANTTNATILANANHTFFRGYFLG